MARINRVEKGRKERRCAECGRIIPVGAPYQYVEFYSGRTVVKCGSCKFRRSETTENPYYSELYRIQEEYEERFNSLDENSEDVSSVKDDLVSELESLRDEVQERFDNIPEQLQEGEAGSLLQERIDALDRAITDIEGEDDLEEFSDWRTNNGYDPESDFESWCEENGFCDDDSENESEDETSNLEDHRDDFETEASEKYIDYLDEIRNNIIDYLNSIE